MAEQTFRSPGFFEREVDLTQRDQEIDGIPAGIIGTAKFGPAFVPITVGSFSDFQNKFGGLDPEYFGPYAVDSFLKFKDAVTYVKVLGAGANLTVADIQATQIKGTVKNAGFFVSSSAPAANDTKKRNIGSVQFINAIHTINSNESAGYPIFTDNASTNTTNSGTPSTVQLVRGMVLMASGARLEVLNDTESYSGFASDDIASISSYDGTESEGTFKLVVSSALGKPFGNDENYAGIRIYTASLDPNSNHYITKILNTSPDRFGTEQHLLYADFHVESEIAKVKKDGTNGVVCVASGSLNISGDGGDSSLYFTELFGSFNTRYRSAKTTSFISQPFGSKEYDLFHFESLDDGSVGNNRVKVSISNIRRSTNKKDPYSTFTVLVRDYNDSDTNMNVLEQYPLCNLNPGDENYIATRIGDYKIFYNFDAESKTERRLNVSGQRPNRSRYVRVVMNQNVEDEIIPKSSIPFGFRGLPVLKTSDTLTHNTTQYSADYGASFGGPLRLHFVPGGTHSNEFLSSSILPPVPLTFKTTKNNVESSPSFTGHPGKKELSDNRIFWGIKFDRVPLSSTLSDSPLAANAAGGFRNPLIDTYSKFLGIEKLDALVTGSAVDDFNNNKFTLAKVALNNQSTTTADLDTALATEITGAAKDHMREAAFIRNGVLETANYTIKDNNTYANRLTFASLAAGDSPKFFNRFTEYLKFTNMFFGGFDGVNILDKDQRLLNDKAASADTRGKASGGANAYENLNVLSSPGSGENNNIINAYRVGAEILTDPIASRVNIIAIPGIRDSLVTDFTADLVAEYGKALYVMDIPAYNDDTNILYDDSKGRPNVRKTVEQFESRALDNNYTAVYFPDVMKALSPGEGGSITLPASVAALGALSYSDSISFPWFAPAGFNRGALEDVINTKVRLNSEDRNILYEAKINPIANFSYTDFVIFGQKTLQSDRSALDRVNVRRMLLEVKRIVSDAANNIIFEPNTKSTRSRFVNEVTPQLAIIQAQQGIDKFKVIMNDSNNTQLDEEQNRLNGRIVLVPTRAVEFIAVDFVITNSGVSFE